MPMRHRAWVMAVLGVAVSAAPALVPAVLRGQEPTKAVVKSLSRALVQENFTRGDGFRVAVLARENYAFRLVEVEGEVKFHTHPRAHTLLITEGAGELTLDAARQTVRAGDMIHVPGAVPHGLRKVGSKPLVYVDVAAPPLGPPDTTWLPR